MINSRQRAYLKSLANTMEVKIIIGKNGITDNLIKQIHETLNANELVKIKILKNNLFDNKKTIEVILEKLSCEFVSHLGNKFVIYRQSKERLINLPK